MTTKKPKRRPCPSCGRAFQKGAYVWRLLVDGPKRQRVCKPCSTYAVPVLASDAPAMCEQCGTALACFCRGCIARLMEKATGQRIPVKAIIGIGATARRIPTPDKPKPGRGRDL